MWKFDFSLFPFFSINFRRESGFKENVNGVSR